MSSLVKKLMAKMTYKEKVGQLIQLTGDFFDNSNASITGPLLEANNLTTEEKYLVGSVLGVAGAERVRQIQKDYMEKSRLKIPLLFMADIVHGYKTISPIPLAMSGSFNPDLVKKSSRIAAEESSAGGVNLTFAPMVDLVRDPRWGRVMESFGEDPMLSSRMTEASVEGFQGSFDDNGKVSNNRVAACIKHFAGYGAPEGGREYNTVDMSEWRFREQYLPSYAQGAKSQALSFMTSFNTVFGIPATANKHLMQDILRKELGFNGVLISDWDAIGELINHGVAKDKEDATRLALEAGVDVDMMSFSYLKFLKNQENKYQKEIDQAVERVLTLKEKLGLFDDPYRGISDQRETETILSTEKIETAQKMAEESIVMLKNDHNALPLKKEKIALIGPCANTGDLLGSWSWMGDPKSTETIFEAMKKQYVDFDYEKGSDYRSFNFDHLHKAIEMGRKADKIVCVLGLPAKESGEATSLTRIGIPEEQLTLLRKLAELNKPIITVIIAGRPLDLTEVSSLSDSILYAWFPGTKGACAIVNILLGQINPSAKLPMSFPRNVGQIPIYYNSYKTGRPLLEDSDPNNIYLSKYVDEKNDALYPFGYGLSYSNFKIKSISISNNILTEDKPVKVEVVVENTSDIKGKFVLQLYYHQIVSETVVPVKQLLDFTKRDLGGREEIKCSFMINKSGLSHVHSNLERYTDDGEYEIMVGFDSKNLFSSKITVGKDR